MSLIKELRPTLPILIGAAIMLSLSGGIRQSFGLIMPPLTRDIAVSVSDFALAMSVQNLAWGFLQPVAGALAVRVGFRPVMLGGSVLYLAGMLTVRPGRGHAGRDAGRGRADRPGARLHRLGHRARRRLARRAQPLAQPGAGRHHRLGLAGRVAVGAAGAVAGRRLRLACRRAGLPGAGARHAAGRLDRRPRRSPAACRRAPPSRTGSRPRLRWGAPSEARPSWS